MTSIFQKKKKKQSKKEKESHLKCCLVEKARLFCSDQIKSHQIQLTKTNG